MEPVLTIGIPTRNRREMLAQTLESCLQRSSYPVEIIVSDNASTDDTISLASRFPKVKFIRRESLIPFWDHLGMCATAGSAPFIKMLCDDDWLTEGAIDREVGALLSDPRLVAAVSGRNEVNGLTGNILSVKRFRDEKCVLEGSGLFWAMLVGENILGPPSNLTYRRDKFRGYPGQYPYARDFAAWIQLADQGPVAFLPEPGCNFRVHPGSQTNTHIAKGEDFLDVQALRLECLRRLPWAQRLVARPLFAWIWSYRFVRRLARFVLRNQWMELASFVKLVVAYRATELPRVSRT